MGGLALAALSTTVQRWPQLTALDVSGCEEINDTGLLLVVQAAPQLTRLSCRQCPQITASGLLNVARAAGSHLRFIDSDVSTCSSFFVPEPQVPPHDARHGTVA